MHHYDLKSIRYEVETHTLGTETMCALTLEHRHSRVKLSRKVAGHWSPETFVNSYPFINLLRDAMVHLDELAFGKGSDKEYHKPLPSKTPTLHTLTRLNKELKPLMGKIEGLGWAVFTNDNVSYVERIDSNHLCRRDADAYSHAKERGYYLDGSGKVLGNPIKR